MICTYCTKTAYESIIKKIESTFVSEGGNIHWSNMGHFESSIIYKYIPIHKQQLWYHFLSKIIPTPENSVYVLFEDRKGYQAKYWLYEMHIPELILILDDTEGLNDYYVVSKKYSWLISENHEEIVSFLGSELDCSVYIPFIFIGLIVLCLLGQSRIQQFIYKNHFYQHITRLPA